MNDITKIILEQVAAKELVFAKFKVLTMDKENAILIIKGKKQLIIKYTPMDLYDLTFYKIKGIAQCETVKEETNVYADQLQGFIQDFFKFEYVMHMFVKNNKKCS